MSWPRTFAARVRGLFARTRFDRELDDEIRFHVEMQIDHNISAGMTPEDARHAARRSFGGIEPMKERYRDRRSFPPLETLARDIRFAARTLRKSPGFTITSVSVLALAIGANAAMFSILNATLFRPLPYRSPEQLAMLWTEIPSQNVREGRSAYWNVEQWRKQSKSFAHIAVFDPLSATLTTAESAERVTVVRMSANLLSLLGIQPIEGRAFSVEEAEQRQRVALVSDRFWQTRLGASRDAIGASIELDGIPTRIIGVFPRSLAFPQLDGEVWEPDTLFADWEARRGARGAGSWFVLARLKPGVFFDRAQAEMTAIAQHLNEQLPASEQNRGIAVVPLALQLTGPRSRLALTMLTAAVLFVLLIAATNVASLSLARSAARDREIAIRAAIGASRARIAWQLLAESLTLAAMSGLLALLVAWACIRLVILLQPANIAHLNGIRLDTGVLGCASALCLLTGLLVGFAPAITMARRNLRLAVGEGGRSIAGGLATRSMRRALVVIEFALAIALLAGAGLLTRSLWSLENVALGFEPGRVLSLQVSTPAALAPPLRTDFYHRAIEQIESVPGVTTAGVIENLFISGSPEQAIAVEGNGEAASVNLRFRSDAVSTEFFKALGTPLLRGRLFSAADGPDSARVAIVNDAMARRLWHGRDPVGLRFRTGVVGPWITVVGVVANMRRQGLENEPIPQMFNPLPQDPPRLATILVRTSVDDPLRIAASVEAAVHLAGKHVPVYRVNTLQSQLGAFLSQRRFQTTLLISFALVALLMAAIGIYGLIQYSVAQRTHEIGIRMAIGARTSDVFRMIIGEGLKLTVTGLLIGLGIAIVLGRTASSLLFGVSATDPLTFTAVSLLLIAVATAACYVPARRAMQIDAVTALRQD